MVSAKNLGVIFLIYNLCMTSTYIFSGIVSVHYQWISKLLTQIALVKNVYDNRTQIVKPKFQA